MARPASQIDYTALYQEFREAKANQQGLTLKIWCESKRLNYFGVSRRFSPLKLEETRQRLLNLAPRAASSLGRLLGSQDEGIQAKAATAILDRAGFNPQAVNISLAQIQHTQFNVPIIASDDESEGMALFSADCKGDLEKMLAD
jgi:hypothetical protein